MASKKKRRKIRKSIGLNQLEGKVIETNTGELYNLLKRRNNKTWDIIVGEKGSLASRSLVDKDMAGKKRPLKDGGYGYFYQYDTFFYDDVISEIDLIQSCDMIKMIVRNQKLDSL